VSVLTRSQPELKFVGALWLPHDVQILDFHLEKALNRARAFLVLEVENSAHFGIVKLVESFRLAEVLRLLELFRDFDKLIVFKLARVRQIAHAILAAPLCAFQDHHMVVSSWDV